MRDRVTEALKRTFRPEFLNRLDGVMVFRSLTKEQITEIVDLELNRVRVQLAEQEITLEVTDEVKDYLADAGYDADYGARPLRRVIQDKLEDRLSEGLLGGEIKPGDTVRVELDRWGDSARHDTGDARGQPAPGRSDGLSQDDLMNANSRVQLHAAVCVLRDGRGHLVTTMNQIPRFRHQLVAALCLRMVSIVGQMIFWN